MLQIRLSKQGKKLKIEDLNGKIFDKQYVPIRECFSLIGKIKKDLYKDEIILKSYVK